MKISLFTIAGVVAVLSFGIMPAVGLYIAAVLGVLGFLVAKKVWDFFFHPHTGLVHFL